MMKSKLGISVGLLGAVLYFMGLFSGYLVTVLLAGYVLLFEDNIWLRKTAVKTVTLMILFSLASVLISLIPNIFGFIGTIANLFDGHFYIAFVSKLETTIISALNIVETLLFLGLGLKALNQGTITLPIVDNLINKYMD